MVKKLIKYDFRSYMRLILPVQLILFGIALLGRIIQIFEDTSSDIYNIANGSSIGMYAIGCVVCLVFTVIVCIIRFYQSLYSGEGYLTHTLPVTPTQHIFAKLLISMLFLLGSCAAVVLSFCVFTFGELNIEIFKAFFYYIGRLVAERGADGVLYIIESVFVIIVSPACMLLKIYFCISVGQLVNRKKILLAFGVYFGLYLISQIFYTILIIIVAVNPDFVESLGEWINNNMELWVHITLLCSILWNAVFGAVYFFISRHIMSKRLNLA